MNQTRRDFLRIFGIGVAAVAVAPSLVKKAFENDIEKCNSLVGETGVHSVTGGTGCTGCTGQSGIDGGWHYIQIFYDTHTKRTLTVVNDKEYTNDMPKIQIRDGPKIFVTIWNKYSETRLS